MQRPSRAPPEGPGRPGPVPAAAARPPRRGRRPGGGAARASRSTPRRWWPGWSAMGYRREYQVEHRGELAVRGSIVDVFGSTADAPVRIDLWGDEVDRLTEFSVGDQRSTDDLTRSSCSAAGSCCPPTRSASGPAAGGRGPVGSPAVGAPGRGAGLRRHGVVAAVADRRRAPARRPPARQRAGAAGRAPPHAGPGRRAARRGGRPGRPPWPRRGAPAARTSPACTCPSTACWPTPRRRPGP